MDWLDPPNYIQVFLLISSSLYIHNIFLILVTDFLISRQINLTDIQGQLSCRGYICHVCCYVWLFLTLCTSLPGSSVHRLLWERMLEWVAMSFCRGSSCPKIKLESPASTALAGRSFHHWATWEAAEVIGLAKYFGQF